MLSSLFITISLYNIFGSITPSEQEDAASIMYVNLRITVDKYQKAFLSHLNSPSPQSFARPSKGLAAKLGARFVFI